MVYQVLVMPVLLYGAECWTMRKEDERRLLTMEMSCLRRMLGVTRLNRIKNEEIRKRVNLPETVVEVINRRRLTWFGHVSRMSANQSTALLYTGRRSRGRPCKKWINNIQEDLNCLQLNMKEAMDIVRDRQEWRHRISTSSLPLGWRASKKKKKKWHMETNKYKQQTINRGGIPAYGQSWCALSEISLTTSLRLKLR